ncbi:Derlin [Kockovaella imperatae]|uniref:Derlin n=1 Tax=Kockovaella imperatae TaxID=4999 RepID=A0A1Y1UJ94_9TREE|nr:Derlin [Kockovaella imperatae]ORX37185.1 Derlin [Kockovaella imperatae]
MEQVVGDIPPVTRSWIIAAVGTSVLVECQLIAPLQLYFSWKNAVGHMQLWRFFTTFFYFGPLSFDLVFHLFFIMRYSRLLEENSFSNRRADYIYLLALCATFLLAISPLLTLPFLSSSLAFALVYIWSRRNPSIKMSLFGVITITAPYLPHCLVAFSWLLQGGFEAAVGDIVGILAGHTYVFLQDYWPREMWSESGKGEIRTPAIV